MKIMTVVGARPQFIKAAALSRILRREHEEILVHTGQHHDANMSDVFFTELEIPHPDENLGIAGGTHGQMTGRMLIALEEVMLKHKPNAVLVYGDTNSTVAAALAAVKLQIPVIHVEAGCRFESLSNPEEVNRVVTDHISSLRFCCTESAMAFLDREGLSKNSYLVGDPMYDAFVYYSSRQQGSSAGLFTLDGQLQSVPDEFYYMTCHRQENTDTAEKLGEILGAMNQLDAPVIYPVHPRNHAAAAEYVGSGKFGNVIFVQPVGYTTSISLVSRAKKVVTDSGGVQREAFFAGVQCVTVLNRVLWPETMVGNRNQLAKPQAKDILDKLNAEMTIQPDYQPFGEGNSCERICGHLRDIVLTL